MKNIYTGSSKKYLILMNVYVNQTNYDAEYSKTLYYNFIRYAGNNSGLPMIDWNDIKPIHLKTDLIDNNMLNYFMHTDIMVLTYNESTIKNFVERLSYRNPGLQIPIKNVYDETVDVPAMHGMYVLSNYGFMTFNGLKAIKNDIEDCRRMLKDFFLSVDMFKEPTLSFSITDSIQSKKYTLHNAYIDGATKPDINISIDFTDNVAEAVNNPINEWKESVVLCGYPELISKALVSNDRLYMEEQDGLIIISDNQIGYTSIKDKLLASQGIKNRYGTIVLNQYHLGHNLIDIRSLVGNGYISINALYLHLINKNRILNIKSRHEPENYPHVLSYDVNYIIDKRKHTKKVSVTVNRDIVDNYYGAYTHIDTCIIPFKDGDDVHNRTIDLLNDYLTSREDVHIIQTIYDYGYKILLDGEIPKDDDVLAVWFAHCTANAQTEQEKLKKSYKQLRDGLVQEYKDITIYLEHNNIGNKKPIPSISIDKKIRTRVTDKIGFNFNTIKVYNIGYQELKQAIEQRDLYVSFNFPCKNGMYMGNCLLKDFYDAKNNNIHFEETKILEAYKKAMERGRY